MGKMTIVDVTGSIEQGKAQTGPPPPPELGKNIKSYEDAERWLLHPSNWISHGTGILYWDRNTHVPRLSARYAEHLIRNPSERHGFYGSVIHEQYELKHPKKKDGESQEPKGE